MSKLSRKAPRSSRSSRRKTRESVSLVRPAIWANNPDTERLAKQAWRALARAHDPQRIFRYDGGPVRIVTGPDGSPVIEPLTLDRMRYEQVRAADWHKGDGEKRHQAPPPDRAIRDMLACPDPPLPELKRIVRTPVFTRRGAILSEPGFNKGDGILYVPTAGFELPPIPTRPSKNQVRAAVRLIRDELLVDFPFTGIAEIAHAIGLFLLPFLRAFIDGPTPLHGIGKPSPGTGADLLAYSLLYPATGCALSAMTLGGSEIETRRTLTATLRNNPDVLLIDNIGHLDSAALAAALTADDHRDRVIGTSQTINVPVRCVWVSTGNNPTYSKEIARRTVPIRLDAKIEEPWTRSGFRHAQREWVKETRPALVAAGLTLGCAWIVVGRPDGTAELGGYEPWSGVIGGCLSVAEVPGFLANRDEFHHVSDAESNSRRQLCERWYAAFDSKPVGVADLWRLIDGIDLGLGDKNDKSQKTAFGYRLREMREQRFGPYRVVHAGERHGAQLWRLDISSPTAAPAGGSQVPTEVHRKNDGAFDGE